MSLHQDRFRAMWASVSNAWLALLSACLLPRFMLTAVILGIRSVAPCCALVVLWFLTCYQGQDSRSDSWVVLVFVWSCVEVAFLLFVKVRVHLVNQVTWSRPFVGDTAQLMEKIFETVNLGGLTIQELFLRWLVACEDRKQKRSRWPWTPWRSPPHPRARFLLARSWQPGVLAEVDKQFRRLRVRGHNILEFLGYAFFGKRVSMCNQQQTAAIHQAFHDHIQASLQRPVEPGYNPAFKFMGHSLDPLRIVHRPLLFYLGVRAVQGLAHLYLWRRGFSFYQCGGISYYFRPARKNAHRPAHNQCSCATARSRTFAASHASCEVARGGNATEMELAQRDQNASEMPLTPKSPAQEMLTSLLVNSSSVSTYDGLGSPNGDLPSAVESPSDPLSQSSMHPRRRPRSLHRVRSYSSELSDLSDAAAFPSGSPADPRVSAEALHAVGQHNPASLCNSSNTGEDPGASASAAAGVLDAARQQRRSAFLSDARMDRKQAETRGGKGEAPCCAAAARSALPLVFFHGIGVGYAPYMPFVDVMIEYADAMGVSIFLMDLPSVQMRMFTANLLSPQALAVEVGHVLQSHDYTAGARFIGHSFGTIPLVWCLRHGGRMVKQMILLDAVVFNLIDGHLCRRFLYDTPQTNLERMVQFFCATEFNIALHLQKRFVWHENQLFLDEVPPEVECVVFLAGKDHLVASRRVRQYINNCRRRFKRLQVRVLVQSGFAHAQFLMSPETQHRILNAAFRL